MASACSILRTCASSSRSSAVRRARKRSRGSSRPLCLALFVGGGAIQVAFLFVGFRAKVRPHLVERSFSELDVSVADLCLELADFGQLGLEGDLAFDHLQPERFHSHFPLIVDESLPGERARLRRSERRSRPSRIRRSWRSKLVTSLKTLSRSAARVFFLVSRSALPLLSVSTLLFHSPSSCVVASIASFISETRAAGAVPEVLRNEGGKSVSGFLSACASIACSCFSSALSCSA